MSKPRWTRGLPLERRIEMILAEQIVAHEKRKAELPGPANEIHHMLTQMEINGLCLALRQSESYIHEVEPNITVFNLSWANDVMWRNAALLRKPV